MTDTAKFIDNLVMDFKTEMAQQGIVVSVALDVKYYYLEIAEEVGGLSKLKSCFDDEVRDSVLRIQRLVPSNDRYSIFRTNEGSAIAISAPGSYSVVGRMYGNVRTVDDK
ncbi:hypothetical protein PUF88_05155 [Lactobacillaceae bacterium L1_55_11]|nr:hypothetical protein [Lactobacillaceae bacterium L1_55_11]